MGTHIPLKVRVTHVNEHSHLLNIVRAGHASSHLVLNLIGDLQKRQGGGIRSSAHDPAQQDIRAFFGGAKPSSKVETQETTQASNEVIDLTETDTELEEGRATSNVYDEVGIAMEKK